MHAQSLSPAGEYYLRGVMETAAGFKINDDSTFQFFFSYGALDRQGAGTWKIENDNIVFNSTQKPRQDFKLTESKKQAGDKTTIALKRTNSNVNKYFHAIIKSGDKTANAAAGNDGVIVLPAMRADTIMLLFEWCPEKQSLFTIENPEHNYFSFELQPTILDVVFDNFKMQITKDTIHGCIPISDEQICNFVKGD